MTAKKKDVGAPKKAPLQRKKSMTCSVSEATNRKALDLYSTRGRAIELAVKYSDIILGFEKRKEEE